MVLVMFESPAVLGYVGCSLRVRSDLSRRLGLGSMETNRASQSLEAVHLFKHSARVSGFGRCRVESGSKVPGSA